MTVKPVQCKVPMLTKGHIERLIELFYDSPCQQQWHRMAKQVAREVIVTLEPIVAKHNETNRLARSKEWYL